MTSDAGAKARVWVQIFETLAASGVQFEVTKYGARWRHCPGSGVPGATIRLRLTGAKLLFRQQSTRFRLQDMPVMRQARDESPAPAVDGKRALGTTHLVR